MIATLALLVTLQTSAPAVRAPQFAPEVDALIDENAERRGIDPLLVRTLIMHESSGNPRAVGYVWKHGRRVAHDFGLMQLHPSRGPGGPTRGLKLSRSMLFDPATNLYFGVWHLAEKLTECGTLAEALGAYSGGRGCRVNGYARRLVHEYERARQKQTAGYGPRPGLKMAGAVTLPHGLPSSRGFARRRLRRVRG